MANDREIQAATPVVKGKEETCSNVMKARQRGYFLSIRTENSVKLAELSAKPPGKTENHEQKFMSAAY